MAKPFPYTLHMSRQINLVCCVCVDKDVKQTAIWLTKQLPDNVVMMLSPSVRTILKHVNIATLCPLWTLQGEVCKALYILRAHMLHDGGYSFTGRLLVCMCMCMSTP